jgi:thiol-disulfide isomerase/thioredoxin
MNTPSRESAKGSAVCFGAAARDLGRIGSALAVALTALAAWTGLAVARPPAEGLKEKGISVQTKEPIKVSQDGKLVDPPPGYDAKPLQPMKPEDVKGPHPVAKPDEEAHDFGQTWVGPPLAHSFKITNGGDAPLEISRVKPSCGCTIAGNYPKTIAPGESGEFPFSLASNKLRGHFEKSVTISSNDPVTPELRLKLKGEVKRYVEVTPPSANFARITTQEPQERIVNLTNNTDNPLKLTLDQPADSKFKAELVEKTPGKQFDLRISAVPPFAPGNLRATVTLKTNIPEQNEVTVDVNGIVPARLEVQPSVVIVNPPRGEETTGVSRVVRFTNYGKNPVKVLEATVDDPAVTVNVSERKAGESYTVQVQMPAGYQPPATGKSITLKTDDTEQPTITVPIQGSGVVQQQKVTDAVQAKKLEPTPAPSPAPAPAPTPAPAPVVKPVVPIAAPAFKLTTIDGKEVSNESIKGSVTVLDFFAVNCGFCKKQIPRVEPIRAEYADKGVRFINVSQKMGSKEYTQDEVVDTMKQLGFRGELALDHTNTVGQAFQASGFPTMVILDKEGKVAVTNVGNIGDLEDRMKKQLDALVAGKPIPSEVATAPAAPKPAAPESMVGKAAPEIALKTIDGKDLNNAGYAGAPATVLDFFAVNCGYCIKQIPRLETVRKTYAEKGIRFVNVQMKMGQEFSEEDAKKKMAELSWGGELARDMTNGSGQKYGANGFPTMVIVGKNGKIEAVNVGNIADLETKVAAQLDAILAGKPASTVQAAAPPPAAPPGAPSAAPPGTPPALGQPQAERPKRPAEELVGTQAPSFSLKTVDGKDLSSDEFAKRPAMVLNFVAPNCGFCKKQVPNLDKVRAEYEAKGIRFVNVVQRMGTKDFEPAEAVDIFKQAGSNLELAKDTGNEIGLLFKATSYPTMVIVGKDGKIEHVNVGAKPDIEQVVKSQLDALIAKK